MRSKTYLCSLLLAAGIMLFNGCRTTPSAIGENPLKLQIKPAILEKNPCYKANRKIKVKGLMLHSVGCPQPSAEVFVKGWNREDYDRACVHGFIDANTGVVWQTLPWDHFGWHGGKGSNGSVNPTHVGVEMCEPNVIKYVGGATFNCSDLEKATLMAQRVYDSAVNLFAYLCWKYNLDPLEDGVVISHNEGRLRKIASGHVDPEHLWRQLNMPMTMDTFRNDVNGKLDAYREFRKNCWNAIERRWWDSKIIKSIPGPM